MCLIEFLLNALVELCSEFTSLLTNVLVCFVIYVHSTILHYCEGELNVALVLH